MWLLVSASCGKIIGDVRTKVETQSGALNWASVVSVWDLKLEYDTTYGVLSNIFLICLLLLLMYCLRFNLYQLSAFCYAAH